MDFSFDHFMENEGIQPMTHGENSNIKGGDDSWSVFRSDFMAI